MLPEIEKACRKLLETMWRMYTAYIKFKQTVEKLKKQDIWGGYLGFSLFVHFLQIICKVAHLGCVLDYIYILKYASDIQSTVIYMRKFVFVFLKHMQNAAFVVVFSNAYKFFVSINVVPTTIF